MKYILPIFAFLKTDTKHLIREQYQDHWHCIRGKDCSKQLRRKVSPNEQVVICIDVLTVVRIGRSNVSSIFSENNSQATLIKKIY